MRYLILLNGYKPEQLPRLKYTLDYIENHPLVQDEVKFCFDESKEFDLTISYSKTVNPNTNYHIHSQEYLLIGKKEHRNLSCNSYQYSDIKLFSVETSSPLSNHFIKGNNFQFDIFEMIFFHISRFEEVHAMPEDNSTDGWLKENLHFLIRNKIQDIPVVDHLIHAFLEIILNQKRQIRTTYSISHDVDIIQKYKTPLRFCKSFLKGIYDNRGFEFLTKSSTAYYKYLVNRGKDPYDYFDELLVQEESWNSKVIYFMSGGKTKYDGRYSLEEKKVNHIINLAKERKYDIGLHPSYEAGFNKEMYFEEKDKLEKHLGSQVLSNRQHWLRFSWKITPELFQENGIQIDSSMGYNKHIGFRCGTGFSYRMYNFEKEAPYEWIEKPMALMESSVLGMVRNSNLQLDEVINVFIEKNMWNTHITFNFHNSNFDFLLQEGRLMRKVYEEKIKRINQKNA